MNLLLEKYLAIIRNFTSKKEDGPSVGLDIGLSSVKMVQLVQSPESIELLQWAIEPIEGADIQTPVKKIINNLGSAAKSPITSVFGKGTLIRYIDMPRMPLEDLKKSLSIEADKYFPFPPDQLYLDCFILDAKSTEKQMSVLVAAAKKELIDERIKLLTDLGLQADYISINSIALANAFNVLQEHGKDLEKKEIQGKALLDMGNEESHLMIMVDNSPRFDRDIYIGGRHFTQAISHAFGTNSKEAEHIKCDPRDRANDIFNACESTLNNLVSDMRLSFDYFITEKNVPITTLYLTGGASLMEGMEKFFSRNLDITVERWKPTSCLKLAPGIDKNELTRQVGNLGVAIGLAL